MRALEKLTAIVNEKKSERVALWSQIQFCDPRLAILLSQIKTAFGRPAKMEVRFL